LSTGHTQTTPFEGKLPNELYQPKSSRRRDVPSARRVPDWVTSGELGPTLRRQLDPRQRTPPAARVVSGSGQDLPPALQKSRRRLAPRPRAQNRVRMSLLWPSAPMMPIPEWSQPVSLLRSRDCCVLIRFSIDSINVCTALKLRRQHDDARPVHRPATCPVRPPGAVVFAEFSRSRALGGVVDKNLRSCIIIARFDAACSGP
jgi:hypothetical protein